MSESRPYLLVDVDGVLNPIALKRSGCRQERVLLPGYERYDIMGFEVHLNPAHGPMLLAAAERAGAQLTWGTTWGHFANEHISPKTGLPKLPVAYTGRHGGIKAECVVPWTDGHTFAWLDDESYEKKTAEILMRGTSQAGAVILVDEATGLTQDRVDAAVAFILGNRKDG